MDDERMANARAHVQDAESRARLATDPEMKKQWEEAARRWTEVLKELIAESKNPTKPKA